MNRLLRFVAIGLLFGAFPGEISNQLLIHRSTSGFVHTMLSYVWFLALAYWVSRRLERRYSSRFRARLVFYGLYGCLGLAIEWLILHVYPFQPSPVQLMMFSFWTGMVLTPCIFTDEPATEPLVRIRHGLRRYLCGWAGLSLIPFCIAWTVNPGHTQPFRNFSMLVFGLGALGVNVSLFRYFRLLRDEAAQDSVAAESSLPTECVTS